MLVLASAIASADPDETGPKSPETALTLSLGGTAVSGALILVGVTDKGKAGIAVAGALSLAVTPSFGEWYSGTYLTPGMALRIGAPVGALVTATIAASAFPCIPKDGGSNCDTNPKVFAAALLVGGGMLAAGTIYDIATAPRAARRYNHEHAGATVVPTVAPGSYGLSIAGRF